MNPLDLSFNPSFGVPPFRLSGVVYAALLNHAPQLAALGDAVNQPPYKAPPKAPVLAVKPRHTLARPGDAVVVPVGHMALEVGASERTAARLFRQELGLSYQQWRQQAILAHALPLLARGQTISAVAAATGYASDSAFSAMFKTAMGQSPSHFQSKKRR